MKNRIFEIMDFYHLNATEFADRLGISKAVLSSIKTGRTQPTLSIVEKIIEVFPELSLKWLILGQPSMFENTTQSQAPNLFSNEEIINSQLNTYSQSTTQSAVMEAKTKEEQTEKWESETIQSNDGITSKKLLSVKVKKILILYTDGTFDEFDK